MWAHRFVPTGQPSAVVWAVQPSSRPEVSVGNRSAALTVMTPKPVPARPSCIRWPAQRLAREQAVAPGVAGRKPRGPCETPLRCRSGDRCLPWRVLLEVEVCTGQPHSLQVPHGPDAPVPPPALLKHAYVHSGVCRECGHGERPMREGLDRVDAAAHRARPPRGHGCIQGFPVRVVDRPEQPVEQRVLQRLGDQRIAQDAARHGTVEDVAHQRGPFPACRGAQV